MIRFGYVGGGYDLYVVYDAAKPPYYASVHARGNWLKRFKDDAEGHELAKAEAEKLNAERTKP